MDIQLALRGQAEPFAAPIPHCSPLWPQCVEGLRVGGHMLLSQSPPSQLTPQPGAWGLGSFIIVPCLLSLSQNPFLCILSAMAGGLGQPGREGL